MLLVAPLDAQDGSHIPRAPIARAATGVLQRASGDTAVPVSNAWVVLHRVGSDGGAPLDSTRSNARGVFHFNYRHTGSDDAIYFASSSYGGIAYFTPPLPRRASTPADDSVIVVYDTTSESLRMKVRARHIIASAPAATGTRMIIEVYEISNDSSVTLVAGHGDSPTFWAPVPASAKSFNARQSDVAPEAVTLRDGRVEVRAPLAPGLKQIAFSYELPLKETNLRFLVGSETPVLELLAEEPSARVGGAGLIEADPVTIEARTFKRFLSQNPPATAVVTIDYPEAPLGRRQLYVATVILAVGVAMLAALARASMRRR